MTEDITYTSYDLLGFDFIHDNGQVEFFKNNDVYNLNNLLDLPENNYLNEFNENVKFEINKKILETNISSNIEDYVKNIIFTNFINKTERYVELNNNDNVVIKYNENYILIFDNMQCSINNVINVKMLLNNAKIIIYIPFILCCEKISSKSNNINKKNKCSNVKNAYGCFVDKLKEDIGFDINGFSFIKCDFYDINDNLKKEYIDESILIGFDYPNNKLLNFNDITNFPNDEQKIKKTIEIFNQFINFTKFVENHNKLYYNNIIKDILQDIKILIDTNFIKNDDNINKFNNVKALIYSMKEMRDWYYVKEIVKRIKDKTFIYEPIFCTVDSINLFRSIIYRISTINLSHYNIKYITMHIKKNNKEYILYKQISPSYFYLNNHNKSNEIKNKLFNLINNSDTYIVKKEIKTITGGNVKYLHDEYFNLNDSKINNNKIIKYIIKYNMDIENLRFELTKTLCLLRKDILYINIYSKEILNDNKNKMNLQMINNLHISIKNLYEFTSKYNYDDLIKIDYKCSKLNNSENEFINKYYNKHIERYKKELRFFNNNCVKYFNRDLQKLKSNKFYFNSNYILSDNELLNSLIISYILQGEINIKDRENFGYVIKTVLNEYDFNLFRNVLFIFCDIYEYNDFIRGKKKTILTFDEDLYDYVYKTVFNPDYDNNEDKIKVEEFEQKHESKYNEIQKLIKINNLEYFNN